MIRIRYECDTMNCESWAEIPVNNVEFFVSQKLRNLPTGWISIIGDQQELKLWCPECVKRAETAQKNPLNRW